MSNEIWVCADFNTPAVKVLTALAVKLGNSLGEETAAVCFDSSINVDKIINYGADIVYMMPVEGSDFILSKYLADLAVKYHPQIILFPSDCFYSVIAARTAAILETGLTADCRDLYIDSDNLLRQVRPAYGGGIIAEIRCETSRPQMATVNTDAVSIAAPPPGAGRIINHSPVNITEDPVAVLSREPILRKDDLKESSIIVAGGKGIGSRQGFQLMTELAEKLGGATGATRSAVDAGYADYKNQIGQTGRTVSPDLYIALGISGSFQHIAGMNRSKKVIAVNTDPKAPIFDYADIAVVASWKDFVTGLLSVC